jgi:hypothetical protein
MSNAVASKPSNELVKNLIVAVQDALEEAGYVYTEEAGYPFPFMKDAGDGSTSEFILNFDEGTVTREKYNANGTQLLSQITRVRHSSDLNSILRHI